MQLQIDSIEVNERREPKRWSRRDWRSYEAVPRIYVHVKGENMLENLDRRMARPSKLYAEAVPDALAALGLDPATHRAAWSQTAGCACGCSPGFVVKRKEGGSVDVRKDVWVTVTGSNAAVDPNKPTRGLLPLAKPSNTEQLIAYVEAGGRI
jgi:hypothetical protein